MVPAPSGRLVSRVVPDVDLSPTAHALAPEIVENTSGGGHRGGPATALVDAGGGLAVGSPPCRVAGTRRLGDGPDSAEGVAAFLENRKPAFTGPLTDVVPRWPQPPEDVVPF